jgi:hypothetical protein
MSGLLLEQSTNIGDEGQAVRSGFPHPIRHCRRGGFPMTFRSAFGRVAADVSSLLVPFRVLIFGTLVSPATFAPTGMRLAPAV